MAKLRAAFENQGLDGILITSVHNRRYVSNFTGSAGVVLISRNQAHFITDFRYVEQASKQCIGYEIIQQKESIPEEIGKLVDSIGIKKLGFEQDHVVFGMYNQYDQAVDTEFVPLSGVIEKLRLIKTDSEIKILKEAARIADAAFDHILQDTDDIFQAIQSMGTSIENMNVTKAKVENSISDMASITEVTSAATEEVSATTEEQFAAAEELGKLSEDLETTMKDLQKVIKRFKVE